MKRLLVPTVLAAGCCLAHAAFGATLTDVKVTTDRSVDASTAETIVRDVCKPGMTDEQKAIALFNWFEQCVYHRATNTDVRWNLYKSVNVYGGITCGTQGCMMKELCRAAGLEATVVCNKGGLHTYYEVKYDGALHGFDTMNRFYAYSREEPRHIVSYAEIIKDPTLATAAVKENRACAGFLYHGDDPADYATGRTVCDYDAKNIPDLGNLALVPGESITWYWYNLNKHHPLLSKTKGYEKTGMSHSCRSKADQKNPVNFPYWEPYYYATPDTNPEQAIRRMYANGVLAFEPNLKGAELPEGFSQTAGLAGPGLRPSGAQAGSAVISLHTPGVLVGGTLTLKAADGADLQGVEVAVATDGKNFKKVPGATGAEGKVDLSAPLAATWNYDAAVKLTLPDAKAALKDLKLELVIMQNKFTRPYLLTGINKVRLEAASLDSLAKHPATVTYTWQEGPDWDKSEVKKDEHVVKDAASAAWEIRVGGEKIPRMKALTVRVD